MALTPHTIYAVDIDDVLLDQVQDASYSPNLENMIRSADGQAYDSFSAGLSCSPTVDFTTSAVATALGKVGTTGFQITTGAVATMYLQAKAAGGVRAGASSHLKIVANEGIIVPRQLTADENGARISYSLICIYNGTNAPLVLTASQSLTGSPAVGEAFVVGPVKINGTQLEGIASWTLDFGIALSIRRPDGLFYPTFVGIDAIRPKITIRTSEALALNTFGIGGTAQGATASEIYLRALEKGGTRYANDASQHIKIYNTASQGRIDVESVAGSSGDDAMADVTIISTSSGTAHPLTVTCATTIPGSI